MATKDELIDKVNGELVDLGNKLKKGLWTDEDKKVLLQRAADLVGLNIKAELADDPSKKAEYKLAAKMVLQHVQSMALLKMLIAEQETLDTMKKLVWDMLIRILSKYLLALL